MTKHRQYYRWQVGGAYFNTLKAARWHAAYLNTIDGRPGCLQIISRVRKELTK